MIKKAYAIRDSKAEAFNTPLFFLTHGEAERAVVTGAQDQQTMLGRYPDDYDLYYLGQYDDSNGKFEAIPPEHIGNVAILKQAKA